MDNSDVVLLRANLMGGMNAYVREVIGDDDITDYWNMEGVPDECDEDTLMEIAALEDCFINISKAFAKILSIN